MGFKSEEVYRDPAGIRYRIHWEGTEKAYCIQRSEDGENWQAHNSSWYPHFPNAVSTFEAIVKNHKLVPEKEWKPNEVECKEKTEEGSTAEIAVPACSDSTEFDYSGLAGQTVTLLHSAENLYRNGKRLAESGVHQMADAVGMAHAELCHAPLSHSGTTGKFEEKESTFRAWCEFLGISKTQAYRFVQISNMFADSTPNEQKVLEELPTSLLYSVAKPSAPPELVEKVKAGTVATNKEYQELLAKLKNAESKLETAVKHEEFACRKMEQSEREKAEISKQLEASRGVVKLLQAQSERTQDIRADRDAWKARAEELEARPIEVAIDENAAELRAREIAEKQREEDRVMIDRLQEENRKLKAKTSEKRSAEELERDCYDQALRFKNTLENAWKMVRESCLQLQGTLRMSFRNRLIALFEEIEKEMRE